MILRNLLLDHRDLGILSHRDDRPGEHGRVWRADDPAHEDRSLEPDAVRDAEQHSVRPQRAGHLGKLVVPGQGAPTLEQLAEQPGIAVAQLGQRFEDYTRCPGLFREHERRHAVLAEFDVCSRSLGEELRVAGAGDGGRLNIVGPRGRQLRVPQVHVSRVQLVGLDGQRVEGGEAGQAIGEQPFHGGRRGSHSTNGALVHERESQIRGRLRGLARRRDGGRFRCSLCFGLSRHPSEPSISSFTSRLNSMAYSIGSSFVNTSRKPWTTRLVASFSVRPRLIR